MKHAVLFFTQSGEKVAAAVREGLDAVVYDKGKESVAEFVKNNWEHCESFLFIGAAGIAVRLIAPFIRAKDEDPAVIVIDDMGKNVIPILSGHLGGANRLGRAIAQKIGAACILTTGTDIHGAFAVDTWAGENGCVIGNIQNIKHVSGALLRGETVGFYSDFEFEGSLPENVQEGMFPHGICLSLTESKRPFPITLNVIPKIVTIGAGCRKGTDSTAFERFICDMLFDCDISLKAVKKMATIDRKQEEKAILDFCRKFSIELETFTGDELMRQKGEFAASEFVKRIVGADNVCERSAWACEQGEKVYLKRKTARAGMTAAIVAEVRRFGF